LGRELQVYLNGRDVGAGREHVHST
jgi:hypothetical protein